MNNHRHIEIELNQLTKEELVFILKQHIIDLVTNKDRCLFCSKKEYNNCHNYNCYDGVLEYFKDL